jgi:hypothetical protein
MENLVIVYKYKASSTPILDRELRKPPRMAFWVEAPRYKLLPLQTSNKAMS